MREGAKAKFLTNNNQDKVAAISLRSSESPDLDDTLSVEDNSLDLAQNLEDCFRKRN